MPFRTVKENCHLPFATNDDESGDTLFKDGNDSVISSSIVILRGTNYAHVWGPTVTPKDVFSGRIFLQKVISFKRGFRIANATTSHIDTR